MIWIKLFLVIVAALVSTSMLKVVFKTLVANVMKGMNERLPKVKPQKPDNLIGSKQVYYDDPNEKK